MNIVETPATSRGGQTKVVYGTDDVINHGGKLVQSILFSSDPQYVEHFSTIFEKKKRSLDPKNVKWFADAIEIGGVKLPELQGQYQSLQNNVLGIQHLKQELEKDCQAIQRETVELTRIHNTLQQNFDALAESK